MIDYLGWGKNPDYTGLIGGKSRDKKRKLSHSEEKLGWDMNPHVCNLCGKKIHGISECQFDHSKAWSEGGETNLKNVKLAHAHCNNYKGTKSLEDVREALGYYKNTNEKNQFDDVMGTRTCRRCNGDKIINILGTKCPDCNGTGKR